MKSTWLSWLGEADRQRVMSRLVDTAIGQIRARHWGTNAPGESPAGAPRLYIHDLRGLLLVAGVLRYTLNQFDGLVLYRGQRKGWPLQLSVFRDVADARGAVARNAWLDAALEAIAPIFDKTGQADEREALAQHYGLRTRWLDVVDNVQTAAWFAYYEAEMARALGTGGHDEAVGYIQVVACPRNNPAVARAYDLRTKPSEWLRPHIQQAWGIRPAKPQLRLGKLPQLHVATFIIPRPLLRMWSSYDVFSPRCSSRTGQRIPGWICGRRRTRCSILKDCCPCRGAEVPPCPLPEAARARGGCIVPSSFDDL
jgi:hypothetical protein